MAIHWASSDESLLFLTSRVKPDNEWLSTALESMNTIPWWFVTNLLNWENGIGNITQPCRLAPHCCYKPMAIVRHSYFTLLPPLHAPSMPQDILVILSIVMDSYIAPLLRFHVPTTPKTLLNWIGYTQVLILRPVNPHCGYFPKTSQHKGPSCRVDVLSVWAWDKVIAVLET